MITLRIPRAMGLNINLANWMTRIMGRLPGAEGPKRRLFQAAMRLGLKQVDWLHADHVIARHRLRALRDIFSDAGRQTLQLLFPGQDLGFGYPKGWVFGKDRTAGAQPSLFDFKPALRRGGRMPHFWLEDNNGRPISVLDLPTRMMAAGGAPCCILLRRGKAKRTPPNFDRIADRVLVVVDIFENEVTGDAGFSFHRMRPGFLPPSFEVLLRPDGHIAWLSTICNHS
jgi:hypothetical protein